MSSTSPFASSPSTVPDDPSDLGNGPVGYSGETWTELYPPPADPWADQPQAPRQPYKPTPGAVNPFAGHARPA